MTVFDRYVARNVLISTLVILLVLLSLDSLFTAIRELQRGDGLRAITLIAWRIPVSAYRYLPVAVLLGGVVGLGTLAMHNELVAVRASGASIWRIFLCVLHAGVPLAVALVLIGEFAVPGAAIQMQRAKHGNMNSIVARQVGAGFWVREGDRFVRIGGMLNENTLRDVAIYDVSEGDLKKVRMASRAVFDGSSWLLLDVQQIEPQLRGITRSEMENQRLDALFDINMLTTLSVDVRWLPFTDLQDNIRYLEENELQNSAMTHALWRKVSAPFSVLVMLLLAVPLVFGSARDTSVGQRIFLASLAGLGYMLLNNVMVNVGQIAGTPASFNTLATLFLFAAFATVMLRRIDGSVR